MNNTGLVEEKINIHFGKANINHIDIIFDWLAEPFVQEFWDNTQEHKDDILNFVNGRKVLSNYCDGKYVYWIAACDGHPFAMLMTIQETAEDHKGGIKLNHLSKTGHTYGIDYMIGDKNYFGKGYGAKTLSKFLDFFRRDFDTSADTFIIDPSSDNARAKHVYMKAGFLHIADFVMGGDCSGAGKPHHLLIKWFLSVNNNHIKAICHHFNLGTPIQVPTRVHGGLLHIMWRLSTDKGSYAIKQLSKDIDLKNDQVIKNYELSERIASRFVVYGISGVCAIAQSGKYLFMIDGAGFLVYPWVNAKALDQHAVSEPHALKIATYLAKMHYLNLDEPEIIQPEFYTYTKEKILELIDKAMRFNCPFTATLRRNQNNILAANESYQKAIPILKTHSIVSHGDLDQKNVLWDSSNNPILIDWESVRKVNPTYDIINTAFYWSGITSNFDKDLFFKMIEAYQKAGGVIHHDHVFAAIYGVFSWIGWLVYNIDRSCVHGDSEHKSMGIEQVNQTLATILRLQTVIPEVVKMMNGVVA
ncbi:GNAT family N-acetyltransferase [Candidatus Trichorickettsia mobilis]|uniref:GNAT family N-acetyltransferase n=1 Tax=Candidatus Trichorickettsia mobilis TaxID=1346319 RepID=UPI00293191AA|nr:GNAT family N-acetyltransferase [Candidatus Trichorickettsia mobilis]